VAVDQIIRTCSRYRLVTFATACCLSISCSVPAFAVTEDNTGLERYVSARAAEIEDQRGEALKVYLTLLKSETSNTVVAERIYQNAIAQGKMESAVKAVRILELKNETDAAAPLLLFADALRTKHWSNAKIAIAELEAKSNFGFVAPLLTAWVNIGQGKPHGYDAADSQNGPLLNFYATDQRVYLDLASGDIEAAKTAIEPFIAVQDDFASDLVLRAAPMIAADGQSDFAVTLLKNRVTENSISALLSNNGKEPVTASEGVTLLLARLASALVDQNAPEQGLKLARIAHWIEPKNVPSKMALSKALFANNLNLLAINILKSIGSKSTYSVKASDLLISKMNELGLVDSALKFATAELEINPDRPETMLLLAQAMEGAGQYSDATKVYQKLLNLPSNQNIAPRRKSLYLLFLATAQEKSGQWSLAKENLENAAILDPDNPFVLNFLGFKLLELREQLPRALDLVKRAYQIAPNSAAIADSLGWGYFMNGDYTKAIQLLENVVKQEGNDVTVNEHLGDAYWQGGQRVDARFAWRTAAHLAPNDEKIRLLMKVDFGINGQSIQP
jgi:Flp pilus assembly protein TadD